MLLTHPIGVRRDRTGQRSDLYFTATVDKQRTWYSLPHHIDITTANLSLTKTLSPRRLTALLAYTNVNTSDFYGAQQLAVYPSSVAVSTCYG